MMGPEQRKRDAAAAGASGIGEALARMAEQHYDEADIYSRAAERYRRVPSVIADDCAGMLEQNSREISDIADIYAWYAAWLLGGIACTCKFPRPCTVGARAGLDAVRRFQRGEYLTTRPLWGEGWHE